MYCTNDCLDRFNKTYKKIADSSLLTICENMWTVLVGPERELVKDQIQSLEKVTPVLKDKTNGETDSLHFLWEKSFNKPDGLTLYLHSKGVTKHNNECIISWVEYMEYFLIYKHEQCIKALEQYDTVGVNLYDWPMKHYSGNFWWSTNKYLQSRTKLNVLQSSNKTITDERWYCEFWLLDSINVKPTTLHQSGVDHYGVIYSPEMYKQVVDK